MILLSHIAHLVQRLKHRLASLVRTTGIVDSYSTLGHMGGGNGCGRYTLMGVATTHAG